MISSNPRNRSMIFPPTLTSAPECSDIKNTVDCVCLRPYIRHISASSCILVPRAHDPFGLWQESRALGATISGMRQGCRLRETGWAEFGYFLCYFKMVAPRALVFRPLVKGNEDSGNEISSSRYCKE